METPLEVYRQNRDALLAKIVTELSNDERFLAAWLAGSYGRNDADEVSDLDLRLVVAEPYSEVLCRKHEQVSHRTTRERFELFSRFGNPALIHENNNNAPEGGTFTFALYAGSAVMIDWSLMPLSRAKRDQPSRLLFDKVNIPISFPEPEEVEQSRKFVAEQWAFFWMMTAITLKYVVRRDNVFVTHWLEELHGISLEIERRIHRLPLQYTRGSHGQLQTTREVQIESIRQLCKRMQNLAPQVKQFTGSVPAKPLVEIETLLKLANH